MMEKSYPQRTCIGCRQVKDKRDLIRVVRTPEGTFCLDQGGKMNGRGAYLCPNETCIGLALRKGALAKSFRMTLPPDVKESLTEELKKIETENIEHAWTGTESRPDRLG